jgi:hypothetical protein
LHTVNSELFTGKNISDEISKQLTSITGTKFTTPKMCNHIFPECPLTEKCPQSLKEEFYTKYVE